MGAVTHGTDPTGVCIVRAWQGAHGLVIRIQSRTDVDTPATDREWTGADIDAAVRVVREFLRDMAAAGNGNQTSSPA